MLAWMNIIVMMIVITKGESNDLRIDRIDRNSHYSDIVLNDVGYIGASDSIWDIRMGYSVQ